MQTQPETNSTETKTWRVLRWSGGILGHLCLLPGLTDKFSPIFMTGDSFTIWSQVPPNVGFLLWPKLAVNSPIFLND